MGVKGLWQILDRLSEPLTDTTEVDKAKNKNAPSKLNSTARHFSQTYAFEDLKGKTLAVDVSIWLYHFLRTIPAGKEHLIISGLFQRICRLLYYGVKPVFVFDGAAPELKKETMRERTQRRMKGEADYARAAKRLLKAKLQLAALGAVSTEGETGTETETETSSAPSSTNAAIPPIDLLASLESSSDLDVDIDEYEEAWEEFSDDMVSGDIDIYSPEFRKLPFAIQERIILGNRRKNLLDEGSGVGVLSASASGSASPSSSPLATSAAAAVADESLKFSLAQVETLIKRRQLMDELEALRGNRQIKRPKGSVELGRVAGREGAKYLFVKNEDAGWTLSLSNSGEKSNEPGDKDAVIAKDDTQKTKKDATVSDIEDDAEFLKMMFGNEEDKVEACAEIKAKADFEAEADAKIKEKEIGDLAAEVSEANKEAKASLVVNDFSVISNPDEVPKVSHEATKQLDENEKDRQELIVYEQEEEEKKEEIFDLDEVIAHDTFKSTALPEYVLEGLFKNEWDDLIPTNPTPTATSMVASNEKSSIQYDQLIANLRSQVDELSAASIGSLLSTATPTKALTDTLLQLLHIMGLPFVMAPFEAEAECAAIEGIDGVISEDSDCLVFGAGAVYTGLFSRTKRPKVYRACGMLKRMHLAVLAQVLGCDYCVGVNGIGMVRGAQLLEFMLHECPDNNQSPADLLSAINAHFPNWGIPESVEGRVIDAFLKPIVKGVREDELKWGRIQESRLESFMQQHAKWQPERTRAVLQDCFNKRR